MYIHPTHNDFNRAVLTQVQLCGKAFEARSWGVGRATQNFHNRLWEPVLQQSRNHLLPYYLLRATGDTLSLTCRAVVFQ